jgi:hypothetical protein
MTLRWVRGTRYYRVHLEQDVWNEWLVTQVCRRIGLGRALAPPAPSIESALLQLAEIAKRRRQRGYQIAELMSTSQTKEKDRGNGK